MLPSVSGALKEKAFSDVFKPFETFLPFCGGVAKVFENGHADAIAGNPTMVAKNFLR